MHLELEPVPYAFGRSFASIVFQRLHRSKFVSPYHRHPEFELVAMDTMSGRLVAGDYIGTYQKGELFLLGENLPHVFQYSPTEKPTSRYACWQVIQFRRDFAGAELFTIPEFAPLQRLLHDSRRGLKITGACRDRVRGQMRAVHESQGPWRIPRLLELLCDLAATRSYKPLAGTAYDATVHSTDGRMPGIIAHIQENFTDSLSVPQAAKKAGLTPNAFCRYFKQQTRRTFTEVVNEIRIKETCRLLSETKASVTEICYACGFGNLAHFHSEFKKHINLTPLKFRKQHIVFEESCS